MQFNNNTIKIGVLTPYSSIYPYMIPSFVNGFYSAIPEQYQAIFQFIPEYIKQGGNKLVAETTQKLIQFNNVDIVSGMVNFKAISSIVPTIERSKKLAFFFDLGEHIPYFEHKSNLVYLNSFQLWQSEYALGYWAHKKFGDKGAVIMPLYDSGYHLQSAFRQGAISAGSDLIDYLVLKYLEGKSQVTGQIEDVFNKWLKDPPSYIHALFCGTEAIEFFTEFYKSKLKGKIPLIVSAHMGSDEILSQLSNLNMEFYSASMWDYNSNDELNKKFKSSYLNQTGNKANIFSLLGYEMGLSFYPMIPEFQKKDWGAIISHLKTSTVNSPRGKRSFFIDSKYSTPEISIEKIKLQTNTVHKLVIEQGRSLAYNNEVFDEIHRENVTGWQNPYLCV